MSPRATRRRPAHRAPRPLRAKAAIAGMGVVAVAAACAAGVELIGPRDGKTVQVARDTAIPSAVTTSATAGPTSPAPSTTPPAPSASATPTATAPRTATRTAAPPPSRTRTVVSRSTKRPAPTPVRTAATRKPAPRPAAGGQTAEVVRLVNVERAAAGCRALTVDAALARAAQGYSDTMAATGNFSHTGTDGSQPQDRIEAAGYDWSGYGENIAMGQADAAAVVAAWMDSPGHRENILNCRFTEIGVGLNTAGGPWWTQNFGTPA
ncbi:CAP domain-containing protein [Streptomyces bambusae]|uniref:CAP domain-containing protein n=1 Tax=Streptomyces bambusae TaxID=1550616 RepID=UPI001CFDE341|nr:CAP domain-containing protein [Streptomyces bambusae]MCB5167559.1 CAP domain-containing protein [Streptomyces bambusae]